MANQEDVFLGNSQKKKKTVHKMVLASESCDFIGKNLQDKFFILLRMFTLQTEPAIGQNDRTANTAEVCADLL